MTVQDIDVDHNIWGKSVRYFKGNTTRKKPIPVAGCLVRVSEDLVTLYKDIYLTADWFFVNCIPFFLALSREILFTVINRLANRKVETVLKSFKEIYRYYIKRGFHITTLYADGEFLPLKAMVYKHMTGGPRINLKSANEHVPDIERLIRVSK